MISRWHERTRCQKWSRQPSNDDGWRLGVSRSVLGRAGSAVANFRYAFARMLNTPAESPKPLIWILRIARFLFTAMVRVVAFSGFWVTVSPRWNRACEPFMFETVTSSIDWFP